MNAYIWGMVIFLGAVIFGLGCIYARATLRNRGTEKLLTDSHANVILAIFFTVVALVVAVDTVYLQVQFNRYLKGQIECNTRSVRASTAQVNQRQKVDREAAEYDMAMLEYLSVNTQTPVVKADDPAYINLQNKLHDLTQARLDMVQIYNDNPIPNC